MIETASLHVLDRVTHHLFVLWCGQWQHPCPWPCSWNQVGQGSLSLWSCKATTRIHHHTHHAIEEAEVPSANVSCSITLIINIWIIPTLSIGACKKAMKPVNTWSQNHLECRENSRVSVHKAQISSKALN